MGTGIGWPGEVFYDRVKSHGFKTEDITETTYVARVLDLVRRLFLAEQSGRVRTTFQLSRTRF